jgi:hypothetical protein
VGPHLRSLKEPSGVPDALRLKPRAALCTSAPLLHRLPPPGVTH